MGNFSTAEKSNLTYLDVAANGNGGEKAFLSLEAIRRLGGRAISDPLDIIEIGPGGGAAVDALTQALTAEGSLPELNLSFLELDGVASASLQEATRRFERFGSTQMHAGDARDLDAVFPNGADLVTASAVLHEVYSYGGGYRGLNRTIDAIARTLRPGGYFAYRDVFGVKGPSQHEQKHHIYNQENWIRFSKLFLPYYISQATHPYHHDEDDISFRQLETSLDIEDVAPDTDLSIKAPVGVLRELQRHYITLRDHLWRSGALGIVPELEGPGASDWLDRKYGHKRVHYELNNEDSLLRALSEEDANGKLVVDGDIFDATTDVSMGEFLRSVEASDERATEIWTEWLRREGSETYAYLTLENFIAKVALRSLEATDGATVLMPEGVSDVIVAPRAYYNRYLKGAVTNPLFDGKQLTLFRALDVRREPQAVTAALDGVQEYSSKSTLAMIYRPLRKVTR